MIKKILKITGISVLVLLILLFTLPFIFKGKIIALAKSEINKSINAKAEFADATLSLFRNFPRASLVLEDLSISGISGFEKDTLVSVKEVSVALNLMSVIRGTDMKVHSVTIDQPRIYARVNKAGKANWDIAKPDTATAASESKPFQLELQRYTINNGYLLFEDSVALMNAEVFNLNHQGSGDFNSDLFTLQTNTTTDSVNFTYGSIPYLVNTAVNARADLEVDNKNSKYSWKTDEISLNELKIATDGFFQLVNDSTYNMDIRFNAPSTDFRNILSLVPVVYQKEFSKVKTSGKAVFNGFVKGTMTNDRLPAYSVNLDVKDGYFQYPDLPTPMKNINLTLKVDNPDGITDHTLVNIPAGHFEIENDPFDFRLLVRNPVTSMFIDAAAKGRVDLGKVSKLVKLEKGTSLAGLLNADVSVKGSVEAAEKQQYDQFNAAGNVNLTNFQYASPDYPGGVKLSTVQTSFNPRNITINEARGNYLSTTFEANGQLNNYLAYALKNKALNGVLNVSAGKVNLNEFMGTTDTTATTTTSAPFIVPANLDIVINAASQQVIYDKVDLRDVSGSLQLANETIRLNNVKANAMEGTILMNGSYSTAQSKLKPAITLQYDVKDLDVQKTFYAFNTVQKLMPVGKWLGGKLNSQLTMTGRLGDNMMPDFSTLTGDGNIFLIEGLLTKFAPLEKLAERLQIETLKNVSLREVREYFEFADGKVFVKPFDFTVKSIDIQVGGMHGFDQSMDYVINLKVPRSLIGAKGNQLVDDLAAKAASRGVPIKLSEFVNFNVKMTGSITNPQFQINLKETASSLADDIKDQAKEIAKAKIDSAKQAVKDTVKSLKNEAIREASDRLKNEIFGKKDSTTTKTDTTKKSTTDRAKEAGKGLIKGINPFKKKATDTTKQ